MEDERVEVLMKEYDTLRDEVLQRTRVRFEILGFLGLTGGVVAQADQLDTQAIVVVIAVAVISALVSWIWFAAGIGRCAEQLRVVERKVNEIVGETVLEWETNKERDRHRWTGDTTGS